MVEGILNKTDAKKKAKHSAGRDSRVVASKAPSVNSSRPPRPARARGGEKTHTQTAAANAHAAAGTPRQQRG